MSSRAKGRTHIGVDLEDPLDFDQIIQELILQQSVLEDDSGSDGLCVDFTPVPTPSFQALQDLRKVGPLGDLTQHAQTALLSGTLFEYHTGDSHRESHTNSSTAHANPELAGVPTARSSSGSEAEFVHSNWEAEALEFEDDASMATLGSAEDSTSAIIERTFAGTGALSADDGSELRLMSPMDDLSLDESISRSIQRVLQLGTVVVGQRLSDQEIQALPKVRFGQGEQCCTICLEKYDQGELLNRLRCGHFFHINCLTSWMQRVAQCPLCRESCTDESKA